MDGLKVFGLNNIALDSFILIETARYIAHHILDKLGIVVRPFGNIFLIGTL